MVGGLDNVLRVETHANMKDGRTERSGFRVPLLEMKGKA